MPKCWLGFWMLLPEKKKREVQLRRTTRDLRTQAAKCTDAGILENLM